MESTTLMTFLLQCSKSVRSVDLLGSWDNFSASYKMKRDKRKGLGHWTGCYRFKDIICDGDIQHLSEKREGGLLMGGVYWFYYCLDGEIDYSDPSYPETTLCPLLPGQRLNVLEVPFDSAMLISVAGSLIIPTLKPEDKYQKPHPRQQLYSSAPSSLYQMTIDSPPASLETVRCRSAGPSFGYQKPLIDRPGRRAKSVSNSSLNKTAVQLPMRMRGYSDGTDTERGRSRSRQVPISSEDNYNNPFMGQNSYKENHQNACSSSSSATPSHRSESSSYATRQSHHMSSRAVSPDLESIGEAFGDGEPPMAYPYGLPMRTNSGKSATHTISSALSRSNSQHSLGSPRRKQSQSSLRRSASNASAKSTSPSRRILHDELMDIPEDIKEIEYEDVISAQALREFSSSGMAHTLTDLNRPRSRRASLDGVPRPPNILDRDVPMLPPLPEEIDGSSHDFHLQIGLDARDGDVPQDRGKLGRLSIWSGDHSAVWDIPVFEDDSVQSPTFSSNSEYSSGIQTPENTLGARLGNFFRSDTLYMSEDEDLDFDRLALDDILESPSPFQVQGPPNFSRKNVSSSSLVDESTLYGYSLTGHPGLSEATITRFELDTSNPFESTTSRQSRPTTAITDAPHQQSELSQISQLMDDFAYLSEAVT